MKEIKMIIPLEGGVGRKSTLPITGKLDSVIVNIEGKGQLAIESEYQYMIYKSAEIKGFMYIPIRVQANDVQGHRISFSSEKYCLNEKLIITVRGFILRRGGKQEAKVIIRYDES